MRDGICTERGDESKHPRRLQTSADSGEGCDDAIAPLRRALTASVERVPYVGYEDRCARRDITRVGLTRRGSIRRRNRSGVPELFPTALDRKRVFVRRCECDVAPTIAGIVDNELDADRIEEIETRACETKRERERRLGCRCKDCEQRDGGENSANHRFSRMRPG